MGYDYEEMPADEVDAIEHAIFRVFPEHHARVLQRLLGADMVEGPNKWVVIVGEGDNGKTALVSALQEAMGEYAGVMWGKSMLMKPIDPAAPNRTLVASRHNRLTVMCEPGARDTLRSDNVMYVTSGRFGLQHLILTAANETPLVNPHAVRSTSSSMSART